jgi:DNA-directed RNA polymerase alpha subunit
MNCDHENLTSRFCPDCGAAVTPQSPLVGLLQHVQRTLKEAKNKENRYPGDGSAVERWQSYADALAEVVTKKETTEPNPLLFPVEALGLSVRSEKVLKDRLKCKTVEDVTHLTSEMLRAARGCGVVSYREIGRALAGVRLHIREIIANQDP